jgi:antitoxin component YwqK of YwqJK toxin-antitoxin module
MKARILFLAFFLIVAGAVSSAQVIIDEKGLYHNEDNELYTGTYIEFYPNGNKRIELSLNKGIIHGPVTLYFESGERNEIRSYSNGKMDGTWITWNQEGVKVAEANYRNGKKHWDDNGTLRFEMHYTNGEKTGLWKMFDESGKLVSEVKHD